MANRAGGVQREIDFALNRSDEMRTIHQMGKSGRIPFRVTHNDTKINNVLFNCNDKAICVIDLDTVMPGYIHFDFGDAVRTFTNTADEDEINLKKVGMNITYFEALAEGFLSEVKGVLNIEEKKSLAFSAKFMTYIMGLRFLTDFLDGDTYYKTAYSDHNLARARAQFKLLESMECQFLKMENIIEVYTNSRRAIE
jgi:thiamine kinase-like enzyme